MSERSIEEILGWHRAYGDAYDYDYSCGHGDWIDPNGDKVNIDDCRGPVADVDDMLTWLTGQDRFCALSAVKGMQVMVEVVVGNTTRFHSVVRGDTLSAALEAAVRKVDAESLLD